MVSANGNAVRFAHGNLKCSKTTGTAWTDGYTWSFMEHQYDRLNPNATTVGDDYADRNDIDLFGWGCTGQQDLLHHNNEVYYHPYNTAQLVATDPMHTQYGPTGNFNLSVLNNSDWGSVVPNPDGYNWRLLTKEEYDYMLTHRENAYGKRGAARVIDVPGLIIVPEVWNGPAINSQFDGTTGWNQNECDATKWQQMEENGALFLPITGYRQGAQVKGATSYGQYWLASYSNESKAYYMTVQKANTSATIVLRSNGHAVRLVY